MRTVLLLISACTLKGIALGGKGRMWRMTGRSLDAATGLGRNEVQVVETPLTQTTRSC